MMVPFYYVVKSRSGTYWTGNRWVACRRCAKKLNRNAAHDYAHKTGNGYEVVRVRRRSTSARNGESNG